MGCALPIGTCHDGPVFARHVLKEFFFFPIWPDPSPTPPQPPAPEGCVSSTKENSWWGGWVGGGHALWREGVRRGKKRNKGRTTSCKRSDEDRLAHLRSRPSGAGQSTSVSRGTWVTRPVVKLPTGSLGASAFRVFIVLCRIAGQSACLEDRILITHPQPWTSLVRISVCNQVSDGNSY